MLTKCLNKIFALDHRSTSIEYGIITVLLIAAFLSTALAMGEVWAEFYSALDLEISSSNQLVADTAQAEPTSAPIANIAMQANAGE